MRTIVKSIGGVNKNLRSKIITVALLTVFYIICQSMITNGTMTNLMKGLLIPLCYYSILAISLNLTVGILGELSLGHAGFMCVGAFTGAFFSKVTQESIPNTGVRFTIAILLGVAMATIFGCIIGLVVLRLSGDYLAIVTLAFGEIIKNIMNVMMVGKDVNGWHVSFASSKPMRLAEGGQMIINGPRGITGTPKDTTFFISVVLLIAMYLIIMNLIHSRSGRAIMAIRDNRIAAESTGIDITKFKLIAFAISAGMAGAAGVLYAHNLSSLVATPKNFGYNMSIMILVFVVLGGIGNIRGSIIAAMVLTLLPEYLRTMQDYRMIIYAVILIVMMIYNWNPACIAWRKSHSIKKVIQSILFRRKGEA